MPGPWTLPGLDARRRYLIVLATDKQSLAGYKQADLPSVRSMMGRWLVSDQSTLQDIYKAVQEGPPRTRVAPSAAHLTTWRIKGFQHGKLIAFESGREVAPRLRYARTPPTERTLLTWQSAGAAPTSGDWTESDRENDTQRWKDACLYNLMANNFCRYTRIIERRDFYRWFYRHTVDLGYTTRWALAASVVATGAYEVAIMHHAVEDFARMAGTVSNELQAMMREGNQVIFDNVFPKLRQLLMGGPLTGRAALQWDMRILSEEQTLIQPLYQGVSSEAFKQLDRIARQKGLPGTIAYVMPDASVEQELPYVQGGRIPAFAGTALTSIDDRWLYGMSLGNRFTPGGTGFNPTIHKRPAPSASYVLGTELARVRTRPNLHRLDAALDLGGVGAQWLRDEVVATLGRLTVAEQTELLQDQRPDGGRYSVYCRLVPRSTMFALLARWRINLEAQLRFLSGYIGGDNDGPWRDLNYSALAPIIRPFSQEEKSRLHTPFWQRIFTLVCDDDSIVEAVKDLGLPEPLRTQWIQEERSWNPF